MNKTKNTVKSYKFDGDWHENRAEMDRMEAEIGKLMDNGFIIIEKIFANQNKFVTLIFTKEEEKQWGL